LRCRINSTKIYPNLEKWGKNGPPEALRCRINSTKIYPNLEKWT